MRLNPLNEAFKIAAFLAAAGAALWAGTRKGPAWEWFWLLIGR
jgi:hypothetical protein